MPTTAARRAERQLVELLRGHGDLSRADLARLSGLPRSTVADALARLRASGQVAEVAVVAGAPRIGRPPASVRLVESAGMVVAVALTHQSLRLGVLDDNGHLLAAESFDARRVELAGGVEDPVARFVAEITARLCNDGRELRGVVLGLPTVIDPSDGRPARRRTAVSPTHPVRVEPLVLGPDPAAALAARLGVPVWIENDANLGALGEHAFGAGRGLEHFVYIKAVDGVGAGVVLGGRLHRGTAGLAGELIHLHVRDDGPVCVCGGRGCLVTTEYSSPGLLLKVLQPAHERPLEIADVVALAGSGDPGVGRLLSDLGRTLGRSLADVGVYLGLQAIILDSTLGTSGSPLRDGMVETLGRFAPPQVVERLDVRYGTLGRDAELVGAGVIARQRLAEVV